MVKIKVRTFEVSGPEEGGWRMKGDAICIIQDGGPRFGGIAIGAMHPEQPTERQYSEITKSSRAVVDALIVDSDPEVVVWSSE